MSFDLNINNYTIKDLEEVFNLSDQYDDKLLEMQEMKLRNNITKDSKITPDIKIKTIDFIQQAKNKLLSNGKSIQQRIASNMEHIYNIDKSLVKSNTINAGDTNIIKQPITPYGQSSPSEFYQGTINPLMKRILRQNINIDTRFRDNYYTSSASNFHVDLPIKLSNVVSLQLSALELPCTFYVISEAFSNNFFLLRRNNNTMLVTVPDGNYNSTDLVNTINALIGSNPHFQDIVFQSNLNTTSCCGEDGNGKMLVDCSGNAFDIDFGSDINGNEDRVNPLQLKMGWLMGFRYGNYIGQTSYESEGIINLQGSKYIYLVVDDFNNNVLDGFYGAFKSSILNKNILARISLQGSVFNYLSKDNFNLISTPRQYFGPVDIQKLQIQLLDEYGRILLLNHMDYSFCLTFQTVYDL